MVIYRDFESINKDKDTVLTIGTFDGLHVGHREIIETVVGKAKENNSRSVLVTFEPHPRMVLQNHFNRDESKNKPGLKKVALLSTFENKKRLIEDLGIDVLLVVEFNMGFANISSNEFIEKYLYEKTGLKEVILGYDHKFGKNRDGDIDLFRQLGLKYGFEVTTLSPVSVNGETVSSTKIRHYLENGEVRNANSMLGREYTLTGKIIHGDMRGRKLGFQTANLDFSESGLLIPPMGVYAVRVKYSSKMYEGVMNIGTRPSFNSGTEITKEVHIFNFNEEIYGEELEVLFVEKLRNEKKFESVEDLKTQIKKDIERAKSLLNN